MTAAAAITHRKIAARELRRLRAEYPGLHSKPVTTSRAWAAARLRVSAGRAMECRTKCTRLYAAHLTAAALLLAS